MADSLKVALAGFGAGGRIYNAPIIAGTEGLTISTILTSSPRNIALAEADFPDAIVVQDYNSILEDPEIELVVITTPNHLHKEFAEKALHTGKHVVVEKPFTPTTEEADELILLAQEKNLVLSVNHNRRWDSDIRTIKKLVETNSLGSIVEYEAHFDRFRPELKESWKEEKEVPGSGILYDLGSHLIDQALWLFGMPTDIFADLRIQREGSEVVDSFELLLLYPELKVTLKAGMLVKEPGPRYQVFGRKGSYVKSGMDVQEEALKNGKSPRNIEEWGKEPRESWGKLNTVDGIKIIESEPGDYGKFYQNVHQAILGKAPLLVTPQKARDVIRVIELAVQSHREKRVLPFKLIP